MLTCQFYYEGSEVFVLFCFVLFLLCKFESNQLANKTTNLCRIFPPLESKYFFLPMKQDCLQSSELTRWSGEKPWVVKLINVRVSGQTPQQCALVPGLRTEAPRPLSFLSLLLNRRMHPSQYKQILAFFLFSLG